MAGMASLLLSNGHNSSQFDNIHLKFSAHAYFGGLIRNMKSKHSKSYNYTLMMSPLMKSITLIKQKPSHILTVTCKLHWNFL